MPGDRFPRIAFIGFGEAGQAIAAGLRDVGVTSMSAWDILFADPAGGKLTHAAAEMGARVVASAADAVRDADVIFSAVTAASSLDAARSVQEHVETGAFFLDINSVSPGRKQEAEKLFGTHARYVDVAVMGPIHPERHATPMLLAGRHAEAIEPVLQTMNMRASVVSAETGSAAAIKMVRSVMIKGIEALTVECFLAASRAGVEDEIMASLKKSYPTLDWPKLATYNLERMATHGDRRAAEMEEVAETLRQLDVDPLMAMATVTRQREMGEMGKHPAIRDALAKGYAAALKAISKVTEKPT